MPRTRKAGLRWLLIGLAGLGLLWTLFAAAHNFTSAPRSVTLPNGMMFKRDFGWAGARRADLLATDGRTVLARDVEFACFNDRYVHVLSYQRASSGLYDGTINGRVNVGLEAEALNGLYSAAGECNGYYAGLFGPDLMFDGAQRPFLPPCTSRNVTNQGLRDRAWFGRACAPDP